MGCDGGTIPRRDELVRTKQKPEQKDKDAETDAKWKHCAITQEELRLPIMSCGLGRLYNKESIIEYLLNKDTASEVAKHIRSLKDVVQLNLTEYAGYKKAEADKGDEYVDRQASRFICPVVGLEMNGKYRFCYLRNCGCVLSEKALKEVKAETCHKCGTSFVDEDIIVLNGSEEEITLLREKMEQQRLRAKQGKKSRKHQVEACAASDEPPSKKSAAADGQRNNSQTNGFQKANGEKLMGSNSGCSSTKSLATVNMSAKTILPEKATSKYSVAKDPQASEALKSLFTTHRTALSQPKSHWITHNPLYY